MKAGATTTMSTSRMVMEIVNSSSRRSGSRSIDVSLFDAVETRINILPLSKSSDHSSLDEEDDDPLFPQSTAASSTLDHYMIGCCHCNTLNKSCENGPSHKTKKQFRKLTLNTNSPSHMLESYVTTPSSGGSRHSTTKSISFQCSNSQDNHIDRTEGDDASEDLFDMISILDDDDLSSRRSVQDNVTVVNTNALQQWQLCRDDDDVNQTTDTDLTSTNTESQYSEVASKTSLCLERIGVDTGGGGSISSNSSTKSSSKRKLKNIGISQLPIESNFSLNDDELSDDNDESESSTQISDVESAAEEYMDQDDDESESSTQISEVESAAEENRDQDDDEIFNTLSEGYATSLVSTEISITGSSSEVVDHLTTNDTESMLSSASKQHSLQSTTSLTEANALTILLNYSSASLASATQNNKFDFDTPKGRKVCTTNLLLDQTTPIVKNHSKQRKMKHQSTQKSLQTTTTTTTTTTTNSSELLRRHLEDDNTTINSLDRQNLTGEQRAWVGIELILNDIRSKFEVPEELDDSVNLLSETVIEALSYIHESGSLVSTSYHKKSTNLYNTFDDNKSLPSLIDIDDTMTILTTDTSSVVSYLATLRNIVLQDDHDIVQKNAALHSFLKEILPYYEEQSTSKDLEHKCNIVPSPKETIVKRLTDIFTWNLPEENSKKEPALPLCTIKESKSVNETILIPESSPELTYSSKHLDLSFGSPVIETFDYCLLANEVHHSSSTSCVDKEETEQLDDLMPSLHTYTSSDFPTNLGSCLPPYDSGESMSIHSNNYFSMESAQNIAVLESIVPMHIQAHNLSDELNFETSAVFSVFISPDLQIKQPSRRRIPVEKRKSNERKPLEKKVSERKKLEKKSNEQKSVEKKISENKPLEKKVSERKKLEKKVSQCKPLETNVSDRQPLEMNFSDRKPLEKKRSERKPLEKKYNSERKPLKKKHSEHKILEKKSSLRKPQRKKSNDIRTLHEKSSEGRNLKKKAMDCKQSETNCTDRSDFNKEPRVMKMKSEGRLFHQLDTPSLFDDMFQPKVFSLSHESVSPPVQQPSANVQKGLFHFVFHHISMLSRKTDAIKAKISNTIGGWETGRNEKKSYDTKQTVRPLRLFTFLSSTGIGKTKQQDENCNSPAVGRGDARFFPIDDFSENENLGCKLLLSSMS